ncbi:hypothetical protein N0V83_003594 [Neocucurbitaria cava]|uniref:Uncharacterized protein n=1 Tax=Neocucurbitaria cava TaxID=798079 RepID=A0A9W8YES6_9PLEO|nr:hypothetical protein N0V83_003594 [Neocucurbitaria cava]
MESNSTQQTNNLNFDASSVAEAIRGMGGESALARVARRQGLQVQSLPPPILTPVARRALRELYAITQDILGGVPNDELQEAARRFCNDLTPELARSKKEWDANGKRSGEKRDGAALGGGENGEGDTEEDETDEEGNDENEDVDNEGKELTLTIRTRSS